MPAVSALLVLAMFVLASAQKKRQNLTFPIETVMLHDDDWEDVVMKSGKQAFVLFTLPACGECNEMKPDWHALGKRYKDSPNVVICEVDCHGAGDLCSRHGVKDFPRAKYFTKETRPVGREYIEKNWFSDLDSFVRKKLGGLVAGQTACNVTSGELCSEEEVQIINERSGLGLSEIKLEIAALKKKLKQVLKAPIMRETNQKYQILRLMANQLKQKVFTFKDTMGCKVPPELEAIRDLAAIVKAHCDQ